MDDYANGRHDSCDGDNAEAIYQALLQDAREGNVYANGLLYQDSETYSASLIIHALVNNDDVSSSQSVYVDLTPQMTHTLQALKDAGLLTEEALATWDSQLSGAEISTVEQA